MSVTLTEAAAKHVQKYLARRGKGVGLRLGVKTSGCSGMAYKLELTKRVCRISTALSSTTRAKACRKASSSTILMRRAAAAAASPSRSEG